LLSGCSAPTAAPVSDREQAKTLVQDLMSQWKSGTKWDQLSQQLPPVYVTEDLWRNDAKLVDYSIDDEGMLGSNVRFTMTIQCMGKDGKMTSKTLRYLVTTTPALTFSREES
jgi:hypothetical protein